MAARKQCRDSPGLAAGCWVKYALVTPNWSFEGSIYFGCREPHLPLEYGYAKALLNSAGHDAEIFDAQLGALSHEALVSAIAGYAPDIAVITTAPTYLFWRCAPPELRIPQQLVRALREIAPTIVAVGPHGSRTPRAALKKLAADMVVMGECEHALLRLANGERDFPGLCFAEVGEIRVN